jgi:hypothetical protein
MSKTGFFTGRCPISRGEGRCVELAFGAAIAMASLLAVVSSLER